MSTAVITAGLATDADTTAPAHVKELRHPVETASEITSLPDADAVEAKRRADKEARRVAQRERLRPIALAIMAPLLGLALFVGVWSLVAQHSPQLPAPSKVWQS